MSRRTVFIGKKPLHSYIRAVLMAMQEGELEVQLVARGGNISRAVDVAELCRRRHGKIAQLLPENIEILDIQSSSEPIENDDGYVRTVSVLTIVMKGDGDFGQEE